MKKGFIFFSLLFSFLMANAQFSGNGEGTEDDPYQITNAIELYQVRNNLSSDFILMNDIDLTEWLQENSPSAGWTPLGAYSGTFDGNGHTIKYFSNKPNNSYVTLFSSLHSATIKNLNVIGDITCKSGAGIAGECYQSKIIRCTFRGTIRAEKQAGGLATTFNGGFIEESSVSGTINVNDGEGGGIVGKYDAAGHPHISQCSFLGNIYGSSGNCYVGGIIGYEYGTHLDIFNCYFNGTIESGYMAGGIIGYGSTISNYNSVVVSPKIKAKTRVAGISNNVGATSCVAIVDTIQYVDGNYHYRIGGGGNEGTSQESLALSTMIVIQVDKDKPDKIEDGSYNGISIGNAMLKMSTTYTTHDFDMRNVWIIEEGKGYPYLRCASDFMSINDNTTSIPTTDTNISVLDNVIYFENTECKPGEQQALSLNMKNSAAIRGFQFDLYLPEGMTAAKNSKGKFIAALNKGRLPEDDEHTLTIQELADGGIRFICNSQYEEAFTGEQGTILTLQVNIAEEYYSEYPVVMKAMRLTEIDVSTYYEHDYVKKTLKGVEPAKCATPVITYADGKLRFYCETEDVQFVSTITDEDIKSYDTEEVELSATYTISVYATKTGRPDSDVATGTLCWIEQQPATEGFTDEEAVMVKEVKALPVLIQTQGGTITLQGAAEGTPISVYGIDGRMCGSSIAEKGCAMITTSLQPGSVAVVKIGEKAVKVLVK